jgi:hypothetical protein
LPILVTIKERMNGRFRKLEVRADNLKVLVGSEHSET